MLGSGRRKRRRSENCSVRRTDSTTAGFEVEEIGLEIWKVGSHPKARKTRKWSLLLQGRKEHRPANTLTLAQ